MMEIIVKDVSHVKLTIAKDRVTVKLPTRLSAEDQERYATLCRKIVEAVGPVERTLRGSFKDGNVAIREEQHGACRFFRDGVECQVKEFYGDGDSTETTFEGA
jgi:hypothetical protein